MQAWARIRCGELGACLAGALNKNSCKMPPIAQSQDGPEYDHDKSKRKSGWGHQSVNKEDVHDHRPKKNKRERHETVCQKQQAAEDLKAENNHPVVGSEYGAKELGGETCRRRHRNKVQEAVQTEDQEDEAKKYSCNQRCDFHVIFLVRGLTFLEARVRVYLVKKGSQERLRIYFATHQLSGTSRSDDG